MLLFLEFDKKQTNKKLISIKVLTYLYKCNKAEDVLWILKILDISHFNFLSVLLFKILIATYLKLFIMTRDVNMVKISLCFDQMFGLAWHLNLLTSFWLQYWYNFLSLVTCRPCLQPVFSYFMYPQSAECLC